jgi:hypothetical protein
MASDCTGRTVGPQPAGADPMTDFEETALMVILWVCVGMLGIYAFFA